MGYKSDGIGMFGIVFWLKKKFVSEEKTAVRVSLSFQLILLFVLIRSNI